MSELSSQANFKCAIESEFFWEGIPLPVEERRARSRFQFRLPMIIRWVTEEAVGEASTETRDISSDGVYFFLPQEIVSGTPIEILLTLPHEITQAGPIDVRCSGHIERTECDRSKPIGLAAQITCYEFLPTRDGAATKMGEE